MSFCRSLAYCFTAAFVISPLSVNNLASKTDTPPPPPPPRISYSNTYEISPDERDWNKDTIAHINGNYELIGNRELAGIELHEYLTVPTLKVRNTLTLGKKGITNYSGAGARVVGGVLTSTESNLNLNLYVDTGTRRNLGISSVISDHKDHKVGLRVTGDHSGFSLTSLFGNRENTFTGDVIVSGERTILDLKKNAGVIAIRSDIRVDKKGGLRVFYSGNIARNSTVTLSEGSFTLVAGTSEKPIPIIQSLKALHIREMSGQVHFDKGTTAGFSKHLYLDDLIIDDGSFLHITHWQYGEDFFLVRKNSKHLADSLKKIRFVGYDPNAVHLEEFNKDYWAISGTPEPATYGAIFGSLGLALFIYQKRSRQKTKGIRTFP